MKKKLVAGVMAAVLLIGGTTVLAAAPTLVGKKVAKEVTVRIDGEPTKSKAIIVNGVTYAPVREIGESSGYDVSYSGSIVDLESTAKGVPGLEVPGFDDTVRAEQIAQREKAIEVHEAEIARLQQGIDYNVQMYAEIPMYRDTGLKYEDTDSYKETVERIKALDAKIIELRKEIEQFQATK